MKEAAQSLTAPSSEMVDQRTWKTNFSFCDICTLVGYLRFGPNLMESLSSQVKEWQAYIAIPLSVGGPENDNPVHLHIHGSNVETFPGAQSTAKQTSAGALEVAHAVGTLSSRVCK